MEYSGILIHSGAVNKGIRKPLIGLRDEQRRKAVTISEKIDNIMDNFNFREVHEYMQRANWEWGDGNGGMHIPSEPELRVCARSLLKMVAEDMEESVVFCSTGGFFAIRDGDTIALNFSIEDWNC